MQSVFGKVIDRVSMFKKQEVQYTEKVLIEDTVPANSTKLAKASITSVGDYYVKYMTGHFETLSLNGQDIVDDGVSHLRAKMIDGSNQRSLFNDYVPMDLFLSGGRTKSSDSTTVLTDAPSNNLFFPIEMEYLFAINSEIQLDVKNDSDVDITFAILFHGIRRLQKAYKA